MITASYHGTVLARSAKPIYLEGNHYFPPGVGHGPGDREELAAHPLLLEGDRPLVSRHSRRAAPDQRSVVLPLALPAGVADQGHGCV